MSMLILFGIWILVTGWLLAANESNRDAARRAAAQDAVDPGMDL